MRLHWGSYKSENYMPYFVIEFGFVCLPLLFGNLYIMSGKDSRPWAHSKFWNIKKDPEE